MVGAAICWRVYIIQEFLFDFYQTSFGDFVLGTFFDFRGNVQIRFQIEYQQEAFSYYQCMLMP